MKRALYRFARDSAEEILFGKKREKTRLKLLEKSKIPKTADTLMRKPTSNRLSGFTARIAVTAKHKPLSGSRCLPRVPASKPSTHIIEARTTDNANDAKKQ